jgi:hypothetical protein
MATKSIERPRILLTEFVQEPWRESDEYVKVRAIAQALHKRMNRAATRALILAANQPGHSSALVQEAFVGHARALGFVSEHKGLFAGYETSALRPDYYRPIDDTGILLEVERGKTTINNMDLLDFWKCHPLRTRELPLPDGADRASAEPVDGSTA